MQELGLYYQLAVLEHLHWAALFVTTCAFCAMTGSKMAQGDRESELTRRIEGPISSGAVEERKAFRASCFKYVVIFGLITILTPPLSHWVATKADVQALRK